MAAIILNSVCLALYDYSDRESTTSFNQMIDSISIVFTILFLAEAAIKIIAMGFVLHRLAYLRNPWNALDFIISISG